MISWLIWNAFMEFSVRFRSVVFLVFLMVALFSQIFEKLMGLNFFPAASFLMLFLVCFFVKNEKTTIYKTSLILFIIIICHCFIAYVLFPTKLGLKFYFSLFFLPIFMIVLQRRQMREVLESERFHYVIVTLSLLFLLLSKLGFSLIDFLGASTRSKIGLYSEVSHLSLFCMPSLIFLYLRGFKVFSLISLSLILMLAPSTTLLAYIFVTLIVLLFVRYSFIYFVLASLLILFVFSIIIYTFDIQHTINRIIGIFSSEGFHKTNLSSIVWLNGWSQLSDYFINTNGIGVGFSRMGSGIYSDFGKYTPKIFEFIGAKLNIYDGSFMTSKVISEFGILGVVLIIEMLKRQYNFLVSLDYATIFLSKQAAIGVASCVSLFCLFSVRGLGYFNFPFIMSMIWLLNYTNKEKK